MKLSELPAALQWLSKHSHSIEMDGKQEKFFQLRMSYVEDTNTTVTPGTNTCEVLLHEKIVELIALCYDMAFNLSAYRPPEVECRIFASDAKLFGGVWPLMNVIPLHGVSRDSLGLVVRMIHDMIHDKLNCQLRIQLGAPDLVEYASLYLHIVNDDGLRLASCYIHESYSRAWPSDVQHWASCFAQYQPPLPPIDGNDTSVTGIK
jgi:hypothetical protein